MGNPNRVSDTVEAWAFALSPKLVEHPARDFLGGTKFWDF
jgi:hypothetical protein